MIGDNLSSYPNLDFLEADNPKDLKVQLDQIRLPFKIISMYSTGRRHYAWVSLTKPIQKKKNQPIKKEIGV